MIQIGKPITLGDFQIRDYDPVTDSDFLYSTWIKSYRDSGAARAVPTPIYNRSQRMRIDNILRYRDSFVQVINPRDTPELILGYLVGTNPNMLHYIYVKRDYRKAGLTRKLLWFLQEWCEGGNPVLYSHKPPTIDIERKLQEDPRLQKFIYDPYIMERWYHKC